MLSFSLGLLYYHGPSFRRNVLISFNPTHLSLATVSVLRSPASKITYLMDIIACGSRLQENSMAECGTTKAIRGEAPTSRASVEIVITSRLKVGNVPIGISASDCIVLFSINVHWSIRVVGVWNLYFPYSHPTHSCGLQPHF
jgi:hypothetical protein